MISWKRNTNEESLAEVIPQGWKQYYSEEHSSYVNESRDGVGLEDTYEMKLLFGV